MVKNNNSKKENNLTDEDPLAELNKIEEVPEDTFATIEREVDPLDELNKLDEEDPLEKLEKVEVSEEKLDKVTIDDDVKELYNASKNEFNLDSKDEIEDDVSSIDIDDRSVTKIVDSVKVDEDGVPLLNQFDSISIKDKFFNFSIDKRTLTKTFTFILGVLITLFGILQSLNDVIHISDHVTYGEHESVAIGIILIGLLIIVLTFYKEIFNLLGISKIHQSLKDTESENNIPKPKKTTSKTDKNE